MKIATRPLEVVASYPNGDLVTLQLAPAQGTSPAYLATLRVDVASADVPEIGAAVTATYALAG